MVWIQQILNNLIVERFTFLTMFKLISVIQAWMMGNSPSGFLQFDSCVFAGLTMLLYRSQADGDHDSRGRNWTRNLPVREGYL